MADTHRRFFALLALALAALVVAGIAAGDDDGDDDGALVERAPAPRADPAVQPVDMAVPADTREPPSTRRPTPTHTPQPTPTPLPAGGPFDGAQVLSYYGNPYTADMGILGELEPEQLVARLLDHASTYDALNGPRDILPALHIVYGTAQFHPGDDGLYLLYVDDKTIDEYIELARRHNLLVFLDLQIGRSTVDAELPKVREYLKEPFVHVALDPEFAMPPGEVPGQSIGTLDATDVNAAQAFLQRAAEEDGVPDKVLIVHQFLEDMLTRRYLLEDYPRVRLVVDMDGFGPSDIKMTKYGWYAAPAEYAGIKLFFKHDTDLMSEQQVLFLQPDVIIYQ